MGRGHFSHFPIISEGNVCHTDGVRPSVSLKISCASQPMASMAATTEPAETPCDQNWWSLVSFDEISQ